MRVVVWNLHLLILSVSALQSPLRDSSPAGKSSKPLVPWYLAEGLDFKCTECSKCCKVKGKVTATKREVESMARELRVTSQAFKDAHVLRGDGEWFYLKSQRGADGAEACTLLGDDGRCTAYAARPLQCRTYPFWSELLDSKEAWDREACLGDDSQEPGRRWDPITGGCEGINAGGGRVSGVVVAFQSVRQDREDQMLARHVAAKKFEKAREVHFTTTKIK